MPNTVNRFVDTASKQVSKHYQPCDGKVSTTITHFDGKVDTHVKHCVNKGSTTVKHVDDKAFKQLNILTVNAVLDFLLG